MSVPNLHCLWSIIYVWKTWNKSTHTSINPFHTSLLINLTFLLQTHKSIEEHQEVVWAEQQVIDQIVAETILKTKKKVYTFVAGCEKPKEKDSSTRAGTSMGRFQPGL